MFAKDCHYWTSDFVMVVNAMTDSRLKGGFRRVSVVDEDRSGLAAKPGRLAGDLRRPRFGFGSSSDSHGRSAPRCRA